MSVWDLQGFGFRALGSCYQETIGPPLQRFVWLLGFKDKAKALV